MSYDYSRRWLLDRTDLLKKLVKIAASGELLVYESASWEELRAQQAEINNLLASVRKNLPEYADISDKLRTWTSAGESSETFKLMVGVPRHKVAGGKRRPRENILRRYVPGDSITGQKYDHPERIVDQASWTRLVGKVHLLEDTYTRVEARLEELDTQAIEEFIQPVFEQAGWKARAEGDLLILERGYGNADAADQNSN